MTATVIRFEDFIVREFDPRNWVLERDTGRPAKAKDGELTGQNIIEFIGYYANPEEAFRSAVRQGLKGQGLVDAKRLIDRIDQVYVAIHNARRIA